MGRSRETYGKKEVRNKKEKKRKDKEKKKLERKENPGETEEFAYVDENGMITSTPPDPTKKSKIALEDIEISIPKSDPNDKAITERTGTISFFNESKGYGFIKDSMSGDRIFLHINNVLENVKEGNAVTFEVEKGPKGLNAIQVKIVRQQPTASPDAEKENEE